MTIIQAIILGIVQGLTEFLPISSSAHLVLVPYLLQWEISPDYIFPFDVLVQLGTLIAVIVYFWTDLWKIACAFLRGLWTRRPFADPDARMGWFLILASIPAALAGVLISDTVEAVFQSPYITGLFLILTAIMLFAAERLSRPKRELTSMRWHDALWIGLFQALSLFPGVSRSGSTISAGMYRQFERPAAARFSFLMSIPVMLGAGLMSILDLGQIPSLSDFLPLIAAGFVAAAVVGYFSIRWLLSHLTRGSLLVFSIYCALVGVGVLLIGYVL